MKKVVSLLIFWSFSLAVSWVMAKDKASRRTPPPGQESRLRTDVVFEGSTVHGRYNYADEAIATVENEKMLNRLLGVRTDFKDRMKNATGQR